MEDRVGIASLGHTGNLVQTQPLRLLSKMDCMLLDSCIFLFYLTFSSNQIASLGIPLIDITEDFFFFLKFSL